MKITINLFVLLLATFLYSDLSLAQWTHACNDTLTYHDHQDGNLMVQTSTNRVFSMQKQVNGSQYRLDYLENDQWNNVLTGTDGLDFVVTDSTIYVLRKVSNNFVIESYDLSASLNWSATSTLSPATAQFSNAELLYASADTLYVHFIDPGVANGGSVYRYDGASWTDLNPGNFKRVKLDNTNRPVGLTAVATFNPGNIDYTFKRYNLGTSAWEVIGTVNDPRNYQHCDFIVGKNDTLYLASVTNQGNTHLDTYAVHNGTTVIKDTMFFLVLEFVSAIKLVEDKKGDLLLYYSNTELGPWGWVMCSKWRTEVQAWIHTPVLGMVSNEYTSEYIPINPLVCDAVVDECNTYFVSHSYLTDWFWNNPSTHAHVRKFLNCLYLNDVNEIDTINGDLVTHAGPVYDFQWIDCSSKLEIQGATDSILSNPANGTYAVIISNGECSDTSECITISDLGLKKYDTYGFEIYPNPVGSDLHVKLDQPIGNEIQCKVVDLYGRILIYKKVFTGNQLSLDCSGLKAGEYIILLEGDSESLRRQFIKF